MKLPQLLTALVLALVVGAYPLLASLMSLLGAQDSSSPSVTLRFGVAMVALAALWLNRAELRLYRPRLLIAMGVFWAAYLFRILYDGYIIQEFSAGFSPKDILAYTFVFVLIPLMPMLTGLNNKANQAAYVFMYLITFATTMLIMFDSRELLFSLLDQNRIRFELQKLNPISVGVVGGTMVLLSTVSVFSNMRFSALKLLSLFAGGCGLFVLMIAASKGPVAALLIALCFYWFIPLRINRLIVGSGITVIAGLGVIRMQHFILRKFDFDVSTRFTEAAEDEAASVDARQESFSGAWNQFLENPLFGDALFEKTTGFYPHNLTLEAFMATGLAGGIAYIACMALMLLACARLLNRAQGHEWLALLAIFFLVEAQFSGSHWGFGAHWVTLVAVITTEALVASGAQSNAYGSHGESHRRRRRRRRKVPVIRQSAI